MFYGYLQIVLKANILNENNLIVSSKSYRKSIRLFAISYDLKY